MATELKLVCTRRNEGNTRIARVYYNSGVEEYVVMFTHRDVRLVNADYYDDDRDSAISTASHYCRQED